MPYWLLALALAYVAFLFVEATFLRRYRRRVPHVVHVNGTRGKSATSRLIAAGLVESGLRVLCKTTGTLPRIVHADGREEDIVRKSPATIHEQVQVLRLAAREQADVLVAECMAIRPEYQRASERNILRADIGVITNVRPDHQDEMGDSLSAIAESLCSMMPTKGLMVTAEQAQLGVIEAAAARRDTIVTAATGNDIETDLDFPDNIAVALAVCEALGVSPDAAYASMQAHYHRDPYALEIMPLPGGSAFVSAFAANDATSTAMILTQVREDPAYASLPLTLLVNLREDRPERSHQIPEFTRLLAPDAVWMMNRPPQWLVHQLAKQCIRPEVVLDANAAMRKAQTPTLYCGIGNLKGAGRTLVDTLRKEAVQHGA